MTVSNKITLNKKQLEFLLYMLEINDHMEAVQKFAMILVEERVPADQMAPVIDKIMERMKK